MAQNKVHNKKIKQGAIYKHLSASAAGQVQDTVDYKKQVQKLSHRQVVHRVARWGVVVLNVKAAYSFDGERYWSITLRFYPFALVDDPQLLDPVYHNEAHNSLDRWLPHELESLILRRYDGPGEVDVSGEGDFLFEPLIVTISGEVNQPLDAERVGGGLRRIFQGGAFDRRFLEVVNHTKAVHALVRKALQDGVSTPDIDYERARVALQTNLGE
jgi:hypothetical protein